MAKNHSRPLSNMEFLKPTKKIIISKATVEEESVSKTTFKDKDSKQKLRYVKLTSLKLLL